VSPTWLVTREADDARADRAALEACGAAVREVPCVETRWLPWPWASATSGLVFFTSRRAVEAWARGGRAPLGDVVSVSPTTSAALRELGVAPSLAVEGGVVALAQQVVARWDERGRPPTEVRYPTSNAGLRAVEQQKALELLAPLGPIDRRVAYEVTAPEGLDRALADATCAPWSVTFASPSAVSHFLAAHTPPRAPRQVVCLGRSTARAWNTARPAGWPEAIVSTDLRSTLQEVTA